MILRVRLACEPAQRTWVKEVLELLCDGLGTGWTETRRDEGAHLVYAPERPADLSAHAIWVRNGAQGELSGAVAAKNVRRIARALATQQSGPVVIPIDILRAVRHITSGEAERQETRNVHGVPLVQAPGADWLQKPVVSELVEALGKVLAGRHPSFASRVERWPGGARAALLLTHDVDAPHRRPRASYYRKRLAKNFLDRQPVTAARGLVGWARTRARLGPSLPTAEDPNFGFDYWRRLERDLGGRGCFYVAVRSSADRGAHAADVAYDAADPAMVRAMRRMIDAGWEIGLHASIFAASDPGRFQAEKDRLERLLGGHRVSGVRHHYWSLDPDTPEDTWARQHRAGFAYDSSLGSNDGPGFRRGLAWPLLPGAGRVMQVPPTLMDGGVFYAEPSPEAGEAAIREHLAMVFDLGGAAVLDWHLEQSNPARLSGAGPALDRALSLVRSRSDIWMATPADVCSWWAERAERRLSLSAGRERIRVNPSRQAVSSGRSRKGATRTARRTSAK